MPPWVTSFVEMSPIEKKSPPATPSATATAPSLRPRAKTTRATAAETPNQSRIALRGTAAPAAAAARQRHPEEEQAEHGDKHSGERARREVTVCKARRDEGENADAARFDALDERERRQRECSRVQEKAGRLHRKSA